jgi:TrfA protein
MAEAENIKKFVPPLVLKVEKMRREAKERRLKKGIVETEEVQTNKRQKPASAAVVYLVWPDAARGVPNIALRSALFGVLKKKKEGSRQVFDREEILSQNGIRIFYTGIQLDQGDLDVWEAVLHVARKHPFGDEFRITAYQLLKVLGKTDSGNNHKVLDTRLSRMKATEVDVKVARYSYEGRLIEAVYRDETSREYVIRLNPKLSTLFAPDQFTLIDWSIRQALSGQQFAQWLHGYYSSHDKPFPVKPSKIINLSGSENATPYSARQKLRKALDALSAAYKASGQTFTYEVKGDLIYVNKSEKPPQ